MRDEEDRGRKVTALDDEPALPPDLKRVLEAFNKLSVRRRQSMTDQPQALSFQDILAGWELTGMKRMGLELRDWTDYAIALDDTLLEFYNARKIK